LEARLKTLNNKLLKSEATVSRLKSEETRLLLSNRTLNKSSEKHQKEARRYLLFLDKQTLSVDSAKNKKDRDFRALEDTLEKAMEQNKNFKKELEI
jgi:hypothetical protein